MKPSALILAFLLVASPLAAQAQTAAPAAASDTRAALMQQLLEEQGGRAAFEHQMLGGMKAMETVIDASLPAAAKRFGPLLTSAMETELVKAAPELMAATEKVYAAELTEDELRYLIEVNRNPVARSVQAKMPVLMREVMLQTLPIVQAHQAEIMQAVVREVCAQEHCTSTEQQQIAAALSQAAKPQG